MDPVRNAQRFPAAAGRPGVMPAAVRGRGAAGGVEGRRPLPGIDALRVAGFVARPAEERVLERTRAEHARLQYDEQRHRETYGPGLHDPIVRDPARRVNAAARPVRRKGLPPRGKPRWRG